jgi:hypothetical protein
MKFSLVYIPRKNTLQRGIQLSILDHPIFLKNLSIKNSTYEARFGNTFQSNW